MFGSKKRSCKYSSVVLGWGSSVRKKGVKWKKAQQQSHFSSKVLRVKFGEHTPKKTHKHQSTSLSNPVLLVFWSYVVYSGRIKERAAEGGSISLRGKDHQPTHKSHLAVAYQNQKKKRSPKSLAILYLSILTFWVSASVSPVSSFLQHTHLPRFGPFAAPVLSLRRRWTPYSTPRPMTHPWRPMLCTCTCVWVVVFVSAPLCVDFFFILGE